MYEYDENEENEEKTSNDNNDTELNSGVNAFLTEIGKISAEHKEIYAKYERTFQKSFGFVEKIQEDIGRITEEISKKIKVAFDSFNDFVDNIRKAYPAVSEYSGRLKAEGWVIPLNYPFTNLHYFNELYGEDITKKIVSFYVRNNYKYLYETFDNFIDDLPEGYKKEFEKLAILLKKDISYYKLVIPWLYMVLDYRFSMKFIENNLGKQNSYMTQGGVNKMIETVEKNKKRDLYIEIYHSDALDLIYKEIEYYSFSNEPKFNRSFVLHGRLHPSDYQFIDFLRLLNLSALSSMFLK